MRHKHSMTGVKLFLAAPIAPRSVRFQYPFLRSITRGRVLIFLVLWAVGWIYLQLLYRHGSIAPMATSMFTRAYPGRTANDYPPLQSPPWRPAFRVVVSLTTTPNRLDKVMDSIESLAVQSLKPDQIYLNIPRGPMKRHPELSYDEVEIPKQLEKFEPLVKVNRCVDDGPATKLLGALRLENDPKTLVITLDDDFVYPSRLVEALAWEAVMRPEEALGVCGWGMMPVPWNPKVGVVPAYVPYFMRPHGRYVDILQACCGNAYRRGFFTNIDALANIPDVCVTVDDVWLAGYLRTVEKRRCAIISKRLDAEDPPWKDEEQASTSKRKVKLSTYNHENQIHYKCVQAIEKRFSKRWTRSYEE